MGGGGGGPNSARIGSISMGRCAAKWSINSRTSLPQHPAHTNCPDVCADGGAFVFLLSIRAGGVGLNLQGADTVIMYDTGAPGPYMFSVLATAGTLQHQAGERGAWGCTTA